MTDIDKLSIEELNSLAKELKNKTKECPICHQVFPLTKEYFGKSKKGYYRSYCRKCCSEKTKQRLSNMTDAEKRERSDKQAKRRKRNIELMTPDELVAYKKKRRINAIAQRLRVRERCKVDPEYREKINKRNRTNQKKYYDKCKAEDPEKLRLFNIENGKKFKKSNPDYQKYYYQKNREKIIEKSVLYNREKRNREKFDNNFSELEVALLKELFHSRGTDIPQLLKFHSEGAIEKKAKELEL